MGCGMSYDALSKKNRGTVDNSSWIGMQLTDNEKRLLKESWEVFEPKKTAIGRKMFVNYRCTEDVTTCLFQLYPEMQNLFPEFRGAGSVDKLEATPFLNGHAKRLMTAVENAIISMDDIDACSTYLNELGRRHKLRKLKPHYLERMGMAMMLAFKELYPEIWTIAMDEAWNSLYRYISGMMINGLNSV